MVAKIVRVVDKILRVAAIIAHVAVKFGIWGGKKFACLKVVLSFFIKFFGIFNGENTLFTKSSQKMV